MGRRRKAELLARFAVDVAWGLAWAALVVAIVLMSGGASSFIYIDF